MSFISGNYILTCTDLAGMFHLKTLKFYPVQ